jgi:hypothetical protein
MILLFNIVCEVVSPNPFLWRTVLALPDSARSLLIIVLFPPLNAMLITLTVSLFAGVRAGYLRSVMGLFDRSRTGWRWVLRQISPLPKLELPPSLIASLLWGLAATGLGLLVAERAPSWVGTAWLWGFFVALLVWGVWANIRYFDADITLGPLVFIAMAAGVWFFAQYGESTQPTIGMVTWANLAVNLLAALLSTVVVTVEIAAAGTDRAEAIRRYSRPPPSATTDDQSYASGFRM